MLSPPRTSKSVVFLIDSYAQKVLLSVTITFLSGVDSSCPAKVKHLPFVELMPMSKMELPSTKFENCKSMNNADQHASKRWPNAINAHLWPYAL